MPFNTRKWIVVGWASSVKSARLRLHSRAFADIDMADMADMAWLRRLADWVHD